MRIRLWIASKDSVAEANDRLENYKKIKKTVLRMTNSRRIRQGRLSVTDIDFQSVALPLAPAYSEVRGFYV